MGDFSTTIQDFEFDPVNLRQYFGTAPSTCFTFAEGQELTRFSCDVIHPSTCILIGQRSGIRFLTSLKFDTRMKTTVAFSCRVYVSFDFNRFSNQAFYSASEFALSV